MAKITIIDLDISASEIITNDLLKITDKNIKDIEIMISDDIVKSPPSKKNTKEKQVSDNFETIYTTLVNSGGEPICTDKLLSLVSPPISNLSSFVLGFKNYIRKSKNNEHVLKKCTVHGKTAYKLLPFNCE